MGARNMIVPSEFEREVDAEIAEFFKLVNRQGFAAAVQEWESRWDDEIRRLLRRGAPSTGRVEVLR